MRGDLIGSAWVSTCDQPLSIAYKILIDSQMVCFSHLTPRVRLQRHASPHAGIHGDAREVGHPNPDRDCVPQSHQPRIRVPGAQAASESGLLSQGRSRELYNTP